jgi:peptidoglycan/LPS O-acetylase OafA/YrhL
MGKKIGYGSLSGILFIFAIIFSFTVKSYTLGDNILNLLNLKSWSHNTEGLHYTVFYSLVLVIISLMIGKKYSNNFGSIHLPRTINTKIVFNIIVILVALLFIRNI